MTAAFLITSLIIVATPGTGAILTISAGLRGGHRLALVTACGCTLGILPHLAAAITGTAALLAAGGTAFQLLKLAGVAYLIYMAWATWRSNGELSLETATEREPLRRTIRIAVLANLLNPKLTIFFFAFLPQFLDPRDDGIAPILGLSAVFMAMTLFVFALYGWFAAIMQRRVLRRPKVMRRLHQGFALSYLVLGARLATLSR